MPDEEADVEANVTSKKLIMPNLPKSLTIEEKKYLLAIERGDMANVRRMLQKAQRKKIVDINCVDSLGRGALTIAIDQEHLEMVELLVIMGVETKDALLHAINVEFVEAVELLLEHEELIHKDGDLYSWQKVDINTATFTPDITPLILAAHRNNYEILKILLDRGATVPMPHDIKCGCEECIRQSEEDSLRHSLSRLNEYKALASPSLIALSSSDPILTAFQLSWELRNLGFAEPECKSEYMELRKQCQQFAVDLLHQSRSFQELAIILNHDPEDVTYTEGDPMKLARLELAITYKQKKFVAHPNIQQLLAALWYQGVPGFRRKSAGQKMGIIVRVALFFPFYCMLYMIAPTTKTGKLMRKPFMKFLIHASSYLFFLLLLILVSLRAEDLVVEFLGTVEMKENLVERSSRQRGNSPSVLEYAVLLYVLGFIYEETQEMYMEGIKSYLKNMWNFIDFSRNSLYTAVFILRLVAYIQQTSEIDRDPSTAYIRREDWKAFDPQLIAEGLFAAANIFSALKLVHLFSINPHLGPLQISLGRMVIDIVKFFFIYSLVLFAFACGLNQLLWYFSDLEKKKCYHLPNGEPDFDGQGDACMKWRRFANVFESSQSLFWASFGMVDLGSFELTGIKTYTRFWGLLMFGSYSVINVIVLLNLLIAMMSNSYAMIDEHSDTEWKFARTKLWMSYFEESCTLPPPFNIFPQPKHFLKLFGLRKKDKLRRMSTKRRNFEEKERDYRYTAVMRSLVWRYVSAMHRKLEENPVTEDDVSELKSDISTFRYEMLEVLQKNGMDISCAERKEKATLGKKNKVWERRLMKDFKVAPVATEENLIFQPPPENEDSLSKFRRIAKLAVLDSNLNKWRQVVKGACIASQIGRCRTRDSVKKQQNLQKAMDKAKSLAENSTDVSRSVTPNIELPDTTGSDIMKIFQDLDIKPDDSAEVIAKKLRLTPSPRPPEQHSLRTMAISIQPPPSKKEKSRRLPAPQPPPSQANIEPKDLINLESQKNSPVASKSSPCAELDKILDKPEKITVTQIEKTGKKICKSRDLSICSKDSFGIEAVARKEDSLDDLNYFGNSSPAGGLIGRSLPPVADSKKYVYPEIVIDEAPINEPLIDEVTAFVEPECKIIEEYIKVVASIDTKEPVENIEEKIEEPSGFEAEGDIQKCIEEVEEILKIKAELDEDKFSTGEKPEPFERPVTPCPPTPPSEKEERPVTPSPSTPPPEKETEGVAESSAAITAETETQIEKEQKKSPLSSTVVKKQVRLNVPGEEATTEQIKSPLSQRNIQRVHAKSPRRQPKFGWL